MGRPAFTTETFSEIVRKESNGTIELDDEYVNISTKIWFKCNKGHRFKMTPNRFRCGDRCPKCSGKYKPTTEEFQQELNELYDNEYVLESEYKNNRTPIFIRHISCNQIFKSTRDNLVNRKPKCPCPYCNNRKNKPYTSSSYREKFYQVHKNDNLELLEDFENATGNKIKVKCNIHDYE
jgi:hypothetical protein